MSGELEKLSSAAKPLTKGTAKFLGLLLRPGAEQIGGWIGDRIQIVRRQNIEKVLEKTKAKLDAKGTPPQPVPTKILIPLIEHCAVEDEEEMVERWANLLAASASGNNVPPSYVQTLASLNPSEATILDRMAKQEGHLLVGYPRRRFDSARLKDESNIAETDFRRMTLSLIRLGLVERLPASNESPRYRVSMLRITDFGVDFLSICSPQQSE